MRKAILFPIIAVLLLACPAYAEASPITSLVESHYSAYAKEDINAYLATYISMSEAATMAKRDNVLAIWENTDTLSYSISDFDIDEYKDVVIASYTIDYTLAFTKEGKIVSNRDRLSAVMINENGWKIVFVGDEPGVQAAMAELLLSSNRTYKEEPKPQEKCGDGKCEIGETCETDCTRIEYTCQTCSTEGEKIDLRGREKKTTCAYDSSKIKPGNSGDLPELPSVVPKNVRLKGVVDDEVYFAELKDGKYTTYSYLEDVDYIITTDSCTFANVVKGDLDPQEAYEKDLIKLEGQTIGTKIKGTIANLVLTVYNWFKSTPFSIIIEAETGLLENKGRYSFIGATSRGPGELYLGDGGASAAYSFDSDYAGKAHIYLWVSDDGLHADGARSVVFNVNGQDLPYNHKSANYVQNGKFWGQEYLGQADIIKGKNTAVITKPSTTSAAFTLDKFLISEKEK